MKKILSYFLLLALLLSLCGCANNVTNSVTQPAPTQAATTVPAETQPQQTQPPQTVEKIVIPSLIGKQLSQLPETDKYVVVESGQEYSAEPYGTILRQEPEGGAWEDQGTTIYVVTSLDQPEGSEKPPETEPIYWDPSDREEEQNREEQPNQPTETQPPATNPPTQPPSSGLDPNGSYTSKDDVALFIKTYGRLPNNFITKNQAENMYGKTSGLNKYGKCIGGDRFYNREGKLPGGYTYYECDIDTLFSSKRGAKRLVFTYSGIIYYTSDHYDTFVRLY